VWFVPVSDNGSVLKRVMNVRVQTYRGQPVLTYWVGGLVTSHGAGHYEILDQRYRRIATVQAGHGLKGDLHEFRLTPQGTALLTAYGLASGSIPTPADTASRHGEYFYCCAQEVDVATGKLLLDWRSDLHVPFSASHRLPTPPKPTTPWDPYHMNSINVDPSDGNLIVSMRNIWAFYKIERHTGKVLWQCGGDDGDFHIGRGASFAFQHHVTPHGNGIYTIFDNEAGPPAEAKQSRGLLLHLDEKRRRVRLVRAYRHKKPPLLDEALGSVQPLAAGHMFVGFGDSAYFTEWDADRNVVLDAHLSGGVVSYRAFQERWRGMPTEAPRIAVVPGPTGGTLYASWNGATLHRHWRVLGGLDASNLDQLAVVAVDGFETGVGLSKVPPVLAVEALDEQGTVLARSQPLQART
jgi:Arylsulfotransferase (ASST)